MNIYVDFDDCLCETAHYFTNLVWKMYGKKVAYEDVHCFNMQQSFDLTDDEYEKMMHKGHEDKELLSLEVTPGAVEVVNDWIDNGHNVYVITGRAYSHYEASRQWLDKNGFERTKLYCLNKYGREGLFKNSEYSLEIEDYKKMHFDIAIEDSPFAFKFFDHLPKIKVMVYNRPWNQDYELPNNNYYRCSDWSMIKNLVD